MTNMAFTKMSSKGQIIVPKSVRELLGLHEGELFALFGEKDTIILKRIDVPTQNDLERVLRWGHEYAKKKGIKKKDVMKAVKDVRSEGG